VLPPDAMTTTRDLGADSEAAQLWSHARFAANSRKINALLAFGDLFFSASGRAGNAHNLAGSYAVSCSGRMCVRIDNHTTNDGGGLRMLLFDRPPPHGRAVVPDPAQVAGGAQRGRRAESGAPPEQLLDEHEHAAAAAADDRTPVDPFVDEGVRVMRAFMHDRNPLVQQFVAVAGQRDAQRAPSVAVRIRCAIDATHEVRLIYSTVTGSAMPCSDASALVFRLPLPDVADEAVGGRGHVLHRDLAPADRPETQRAPQTISRSS
jgi:hypothetical protein